MHFDNISNAIAYHIKDCPIVTYLKFVGDDGSQGFRYGREYKIRISKVADHFIVETESGLYCPYSSIKTLLQNWSVIE